MNGRYASRASSPSTGTGRWRSSVHVNREPPPTGSRTHSPTPRTRPRCAITSRPGGFHIVTSRWSVSSGTPSTRVRTATITPTPSRCDVSTRTESASFIHAICSSHARTRPHASSTGTGRPISAETLTGTKRRRPGSQPGCLPGLRKGPERLGEREQQHQGDHDGDGGEGEGRPVPQPVRRESGDERTEHEPQVPHEPERGHGASLCGLGGEVGEHRRLGYAGVAR